MKVLITGGAGFIGSHLADEFIKMGSQVTIIDNLSTGKRENINPAIYHWNEDLNNISVKDLIPMLKDVKYVFHLAAKTSVEESIQDPSSYIKHNLIGMVNLLTACHKAGVSKFIFSSSSSIYGDPDELPTSENCKTNCISAYALSKEMGEDMCKMFSKVHGLNTISLRYFNVYGDRMNEEGAYKLVIPIFSELIKQGKPCTITNNGEQSRDFINVKDVVQANISVAIDHQTKPGDVYNVGSGENYTVNKIADMLGGVKTYGEERIEPFETLANISKITEEIGWKPQISFSDWINEYKKTII